MKRKFDCDTSNTIYVMTPVVYGLQGILTRNICSYNTPAHEDKTARLLLHRFNKDHIISDICDNVLEFEDWFNLSQNQKGCFFRYYIWLCNIGCKEDGTFEAITMISYWFHPLIESNPCEEIKR
jgi:hypothetical protein